MVKDRFERCEKKYMLSREQYDGLMSEMPPFMVRDLHAESEIRSVYYDLDNYQLIRRSVEKPYYKEKFRIRSYGVPQPDTRVFVEVKKKLDGIVYKRRSMARFEDVLNNDFTHIEDPIIQNEVRAFLDFYGDLKPKCLIKSVRKYWHDEGNENFRMTFDMDMEYSIDVPSLDYTGELKPFFDDERIIMELKIPEAIPLWLSKLLSKYGIFPHSFSKIGYIFSNKILKGDN